VCTVFLQHKYRRVNYVQGNDSHLLPESKETSMCLVKTELIRMARTIVTAFRRIHCAEFHVRTEERFSMVQEPLLG
jgi:hypothetical protein